MKCRNVYVNKHLRNYNQIANSLRKKTKDSYVIKQCLNCKNDLKYEKRNNKFCTKSCSTSYTNLGRVNTQDSNDRRRKSLLVWNEQNQRNIIQKRNCKWCQIEY